MDVMQEVVKLCDESITEWESSNTPQVGVMPSHHFILKSYSQECIERAPINGPHELSILHHTSHAHVSIVCSSASSFRQCPIEALCISYERNCHRACDTLGMVQVRLGLHMGCPAKRSSQAQVMQDPLQGQPPDQDKLTSAMQVTVAEYEADMFYDLEEVLQTAVDLEMPKLLACYERRATKIGPFGRHNLPASSQKRVKRAFFRAQDSWNACLWRQDPKPPFNYPWCDSHDHIPLAKEFAEWASEEAQEGKSFPSRKRKRDSFAALQSSCMV